MKKLMSLCLVLVLAGVSLADVKVKGEVNYEPYKKIVLKATEVTSTKAQFLWEVEGTSGTVSVPDIVELGDTLYIWTPPGTYKVTLIAVDFAAQKIERAKFNFKVGGTPIPPDPIDPVDPPVPDDTFTKSIRDAFNSETDPAKSSQLAFYSAVFKMSGSLVDASTTNQDLFTKLSAAIHAPVVGLPQGALPKVSKVVGTYLNTELGTVPSATVDKAKAKSALKKVSDSLVKIVTTKKKGIK